MSSKMKFVESMSGFNKSLALGAALCFTGLGCSHEVGDIPVAGGTSSASSAPLVVANSVMRDQGASYALASTGGLVANLYVQPRDQMIAPDTQVVGCSQEGNGALGLSSYLSQPSWLTGQFLFTDLNVPARNFLAGFPVTTGVSPVPVKSYFAFDMKGSFHLAAGEPAGYYQFAGIADDAVAVRTSSEGSYDELLVDDSKPAGANGGCLEQTQAPHMSCSTNWSNQSATVRTVYLHPGDSIPLEVQYWQGPGGGIAMMVLYRQVMDPSAAANAGEADCGAELDFSASGAGLTDVLTRWKIVSFANLSAQ